MDMKYLSILFFLLLITGIASAGSTPPIPVCYHGSVTIDGTAAPAGTVVIAKVNWNERGRIVTTIPGHYGSQISDNVDDMNLQVSPTADDYSLGSPAITFWINGNIADQKVPLTTDMQGGSFILALSAESGIEPEKPAGSEESGFDIDDVEAGEDNLVTVTTGGESTVNAKTDGNSIVVTDVGSGWGQITLNTEDAPINKGNAIIGTVTNVIAECAPVSGNIDESPVSAEFEVEMETMPGTDAGISSTITKTPKPDAKSAFVLAADDEGKKIKEIAYSLNLEKTGLKNEGEGGIITGAKIRMSVSPSWVSANGGKNRVVIYRYSDDGKTTQRLETHFVEIDGEGNYVFEGISPNGLSVFALVALADKSKPSSGGGGGSGGISTTPTENKTEVQPDLIPVFTEKSEIGIKGAAVGLDSAGNRVISLDRKYADSQGQTVIVAENDIRVKMSGFIVTVCTDGITESEGIISGNVTDVIVASETLEKTLKGLGPIVSSYEAHLADVPTGSAMITTSVASDIPENTMTAFTELVTGQNMRSGGIAYIMSVTKTAVPETRNGKITMGVPAIWVESHGGKDTICILREADDGKTSILKTSADGSDEKGNLIFSAPSPDGLCCFAVASITEKTVSPEATATGKPVGPDSGESKAASGFPWAGIICLILLAGVICGAYYYTGMKKD